MFGKKTQESLQKKRDEKIWQGRCSPPSGDSTVDEKNDKKRGYCNPDEVLEPVVPLEHYIVQHSPDDDSSSESHLNYVGRDELVKGLLDVLIATRTDRGCYLVAGYRGVGKTRFVNRVLNFYKHNFEKSVIKGNKNLSSATEIHKKQFIKWVSQGGKIVENARSKKKPQQLEPDFLDAYGDFESEIEKIKKKRQNSRWNKKVIDVRINLGHDSSFTVKDVLSDISQLIEQELTAAFSMLNNFFRWVRVILLALIFPVCFYASICFFKSPDGGLGGILDISSSPINAVFFGSLAVAGVISLIAFWLLARLSSSIYFPIELIEDFKELNRDISNDSNQELRLGSSRYFGFFGKSYSQQKLDERNIESRLIHLINKTQSHNKKILSEETHSRHKSIIDLIIVFDELDKITGYGKHINDNVDGASQGYKDIVRRRTSRVVDLLSGLKNLITSAGMRFIFIGGREMLDSYQAERGSTNSLYESLFDDVFEIPSLLTDNSEGDSGRLASLTEAYVVKRLMDPRVASYIWYLKEQKKALAETQIPHVILVYKVEIESFIENPDYGYNYQKLVYEPYILGTYFTYLIHMGVPEICARQVVHNLRNLVHFLTIYSWGNCKRLSSLFESFVKSGNLEVAFSRPKMPNATEMKHLFYISFDYITQQRLSLGSNIYIMYHHHLSREMRYSGDKLAVATMSALHFILKFHHWGFSRHHLHLMTEALNIFSSPELNSSIDTVISLVLRPYLRRIRNGLYRYRFNFGFSQEIRYISRISDLESASFTFSLDAMEEVKEQYRKNLEEVSRQCGTVSEMTRPMAQNTIAEQNITLGDLFALENDYDDAASHFQQAIDVYESWQFKKGQPDNLPPEKLQRLIEAMLKLGDIEERRQRYDRAATIYQQARCKVENALEQDIQPSKDRAYSADEHNDYSFLKSGDSKWDTFKQPYWAALFLNLKRSTNVARDLNENVRLPSFLYKTESEARGNFRLGNYFFFMNDHERAIDCYMKTIESSEILNYSREYSAFLGGYAMVNLADNLIVHFIRESQKIMWSMNEQQKNLDSICLDYINRLNDFLGVDSGNKPFTSIDSLIDQVFSRSKCGMKIRPRFEKKLNKIKPEKEKQWEWFNIFGPGSINISECIALYLFAGERFFDNAMYYHASITYTRLLYMWGLLLDLYPWSWMKNSQYKIIKKYYKESSSWIKECRFEALEAISSVHSRSHTTFVAAAYQRDFNAWFNAKKNQFEPMKEIDHKIHTKLFSFVINKSTFNKLKIYTNGTTIVLDNDKFYNSQELDKLSSVSSQVTNPLSILFGSENTPDEISHSIFWHRSIFAQKMIFGALYEYSVRNSICEHKVFPVDIVRQDLPIHSTDASIMSRWLLGRSLALEFDHLCFLGVSLEYQAKDGLIEHLCIGKENKHFEVFIPFENLALLSKTMNILNDYMECSFDWLNLELHPQDYRNALYQHAHKAIKNLYLASKDIRMISDNDQALNFPPQSFIFKSIWLILLRLNKFEIWRNWLSQPRNNHDNIPISSEGKLEMKLGCHYQDISSIVQQELSKVGGKNIPYRIYDLSYVTNRTKRYLKAAWKMGDVSGRARGDLLRNRYFLSDDYDDPEFHAIWSQIQVTSATAYILYLMIAQEIENFKRDYFSA